MNSTQLVSFIRRDDQTDELFQGIYPVDRLPTITVYPSFIIINTSKSHVYNGHWILLYMKNNEEVIFFDSYGRPPDNVNNGCILTKYLSKYNVEYNHFLLQSRSSNVCGLYCIYVAFYLSRGVSFNKMFSQFYTDVDCNDTLLVKKVKHLFSSK